MIEYRLNEDGVPLGKKGTVSRQWKEAGDFNVSIRINKYGFRDEKNIDNSTESDIFVVGDSFSIGHGVQENRRYSNLLESMLDMPVYNISIPTDFDGYEKLIKYAQENGAKIKTIIIGVCMENDLKNYESDDLPYYSNRHNNLLMMKMYLTKKSAIYNAFTSIIHGNIYLKRIFIKMGIVDENYASVNKSVYSEEILDSSVKRLMKLKTERNTPNVIIVIIPSRSLWIGDNQKVELEVHNRFITLLKGCGFKVIDLRSAFEKEGKPLEYYFINDGHWNEKGHKRAAEVIYTESRSIPSV